ncbi:hypothetical protein ACX0G7_21285 [Flavitalea antarctica]
MESTRRKFLIDSSRAGLGVFVCSSLPGLSFLEPSKSNLVAKIVEDKGVSKISINGKIFESLSFRSFRPEERNISEFYGAGIRLMSVLHTGLDCTLDVPYSPFGESWKGPGQYDFSVIDKQMDLFIKHAPDAYFNIMLQLDTRDWYVKSNECNSNSYWNLVEMVGHQPWREDTARFLQDMLRYFEKKYGDKVFAYSLFCGASTEWYTNSQGNGRPEAMIRYHPLKEAAYRKFTGDPSLKLLPLDTLHKTTNGVFRDPVADATALKYWHFHHEIIGDGILYFLKKSQEVLHHKKLLGVYYGYLTQLDNKRLLEEGHLGYEKVWSSPDIDMIFAPAKYGKPRDFEGESGFLLTLDSLKLHKKLLFQEIDHTTYIAPQTVENGRRIPGSNTKLKDEFQTVHVLRREFVLTRVKNASLWWFDFFGGYFYAKPLMNEIEKMISMQQEHLRHLHLESIAEIAVFGDVKSMYYTQAFSSLATDLLVTPPDELARIGAPYDIYNFSDIDHPDLPLERYKLIIILNAFEIAHAKKEFIKAKMQTGGRTVLWMYAPGYIQDKKFSLESISSTTGFAIKRREAADSRVQVTAQNLSSQFPTDITFDFTRPIKPLFELAEANAEILGTYVSDGKAAFARKKFSGYTSVYCAVGGVPAKVLREIARTAGVHIFYEGSDPVYINNRLIGIHMQTDVTHRLTLKTRKNYKLQELFDGGTINVKNGECVLPHRAGYTKLYLLNS